MICNKYILLHNFGLFRSFQIVTINKKFLGIATTYKKSGTTASTAAIPIAPLLALLTGVPVVPVASPVLEDGEEEEGVEVDGEEEAEDVAVDAPVVVGSE
jgi:hypothetical protein